MLGLFSSCLGIVVTMRTNTKKPSYITEQHKLMDEKFSVVRTKQNGDIYQFMMWIDDEKKMIRRTLRTESPLVN